MKHTVTFQPSGARYGVDDGASLLDAARGAGERLTASCGGKGVCGKCRVVPVEGELGPASDAERRLLGPAELADGVRLACQATVRSSTTVSVPEDSGGAGTVVLGADGSRVFPLDPPVRDHYVELRPPSHSDNSADAERLTAALGSAYGLEGLEMGIGALRQLHGAAVEGGWKVTAAVRRGRDVVRLSPGYHPRILGVSFDAGTTTLAASLSDLATGVELASEAMTNPLTVMGDDVLSRVSYAAAHRGGLADMRGLLLDALNGMLDRMLQGAGADADDVLEAVAVGNTAMHHIMLGIPLDALGVHPFTPAVTGAMEVPAAKAGIRINPAGRLYAPPPVAGFIGSDTTAVMAAAGPLHTGGVTLFADIGTNGELVLAHRGGFVAASCATGPALEGAQISSGMRAAPGAIERAIVDPDSWDVSYRVIGADAWSVPGRQSGARGLCGSGTVDVVAQMRRAGVLDRSGRIDSDTGSPRVIKGARGEAEFVVAYPDETRSGRAVTVTQSDVRAVQLAKAAVAAGIRILLAEAGVDAPDRLVVAGAFGNYLDIRNAASIGMFPACRPEDAVQAGNAAGDGARALLLSLAKREETERLVAGFRYVELSNHPAFQERFLENMDLP